MNKGVLVQFLPLLTIILTVLVVVAVRSKLRGGVARVPRRKYAKSTIGIWIFGLIASGIIGGFIGSIFDQSPYSGGFDGLLGLIAGCCAFACFRLWFAPAPQTEALDRSEKTAPTLPREP